MATLGRWAAVCVLCSLLAACEVAPMDSITPSPLPTASPLPSPALPPSPLPTARLPSPTLPPSPLATPSPAASLVSPLPSATPDQTQPPPRYPTQPPEEVEVVAAAQAFLADQLNVPPEQVELLWVEQAEWESTGLGCPQPGEAYAPVVTPGYRILLQVTGRTYEVHTDRFGKQVVLCQGPVGGERVPLGRARSQDEVVQAARKHLAERLDVSPAEVTVIEVEETYWEDETLGCPRSPGQYPDRAYPQLIPGYRVVLQVGGTRYEYHSGPLWLIYCGTLPG